LRNIEKFLGPFKPKEDNSDGVKITKQDLKMLENGDVYLGDWSSTTPEQQHGFGI
jgi:hypothetical protein